MGGWRMKVYVFDGPGMPREATVYLEVGPAEAITAGVPAVVERACRYHDRITEEELAAMGGAAMRMMDGLVERGVVRVGESEEA